MFGLIFYASLLIGATIAYGAMAVETANYLPLGQVLCLMFHAFLGLFVSLNLFRLSLTDPDDFRDVVWFHKHRIEKLYLISTFVLYITIVVYTILYQMTIVFRLGSTSFKVHFVAYHVVTLISAISVVILRQLLHDRDLGRVVRINPRAPSAAEV